MLLDTPENHVSLRPIIDTIGIGWLINTFSIQNLINLLTVKVESKWTAGHFISF